MLVAKIRRFSGLSIWLATRCPDSSVTKEVMAGFSVDGSGRMRLTGYWRMTYGLIRPGLAAYGSPRSQKRPVMSCSASRATLASRCSSGACCRQFGYECGIKMVGSPRVVAKQSFGMVPPRLGKIVTALAVVAAIDAWAQFTHA